MDTEADKNRIGRAIVFGFSDCSDSFFLHKEYFVQIFLRGTAVNR